MTFYTFETNIENLLFIYSRTKIAINILFSEELLILNTFKLEPN